MILFRLKTGNEHQAHPVRALRPIGAVTGILWLSFATSTGWTQEAASTGTTPPAKDALEPNLASPQAPASITELSLEELMDVKVTTVSRQESTVGQSAAAVFVITQEMIQRSGATVIPELFRMVPGMAVARLDNNKWAITARGFNNRTANKLLVQIDGRTVYNPIYSGVYWETVDYPLEDIERIEVIRGPGASVWGSNAVNGIINIITKSAHDTQGQLLVVGGGTEEQAFVTYREGGQTGKDGENGHYRVYAKGFAHDSSFNALGDERDRWQSGSAGFRYEAPLRGDSTFTLQGDVFSTSASQRSIDVDLGSPPTFATSRVLRENAQGANILGRWTGTRKSGSEWSLQAYYDRSQRQLTSGYGRFATDTLDIDYQNQIASGARHRFVYGAAYRMQKIKFQGSTGIDGGFAVGPANLDVTRDVLSAFVQDEAKLSDKLSLTLGSKFEHNDYTGFEYQPSARFLWAPSKRHSAWASVSRAVRTPSLIENDITLTAVPGPGPTVFLQLAPNRDLSAESVVAHEIGYRAQVSDTISFDATAFYNKYNNLIGFQPGTPGLGPVPGTFVFPIPYANNLKANTYGFELAANWNPSRNWKLYGAYTYLNMDLRVDPGVSPAVIGPLEAAENQSPRNQIYLRSSFDLPKQTQFDLIGRYVSRLSGFTPSVPSYVAVDARLAWKPREQLELAIIGQNLFDSHHQEYGGGPVIMEPERGIYGKVTYHW
jgi:iron complex outermembrane receptor protein